MRSHIRGHSNFAHKCTSLNPFDLLKDSEGVPLIDSNNTQLKTVKV